MRYSLVCKPLTVVGLLVALLAAADPQKLPPGTRPLAEAPGIQNLFALGTNLFSGSTPEGDAGFATLAKLGVKTVVSVDGARPDVERARTFGMRYAHLPHGYDGISTRLQLQLAQVATTLPGPVYVHCHHGRHRGPTAAAVMCIALEGWSNAQAEDWLTLAGTSTNYSGLFGVVRKFKPPTADQLAQLRPDVPEVAQVSGLTDIMVAVDERWDHLSAARAAGYRAPKLNPDLVPAHEAVLLWELYREARRLADSALHGPDFIGRLKATESEVKETERLLRAFAIEPKPDLRAQLDRTFDAITKSCLSCHRIYRDADGIKSSR